MKSFEFFQDSMPNGGTEKMKPRINADKRGLINTDDMINRNKEKTFYYSPFFLSFFFLSASVCVYLRFHFSLWQNN
jgi:hypothetical protein